MPLDPSIILGIRPPDFQSPTQTLGGLMQLQNMQQQNQSNQMLLAERTRAVQDNAAINGAVRKFASPSGLPDYDAAAADLEANGFGSAALTLRKNVYDQRKSMAENVKAQQENLKTRFGLASQVASTIDDDASFQRGKKAIASLIGNDLANQMGETYDPAIVKKAIALGMSAKEQAEVHHNAAQDALDALRLQQEGPGKAAEAFDKWTQSASKLFSSIDPNAPDAAQRWDASRGLLHEAGASADVLSQFAPTYSADAVKAAGQVGISPKDRATLAGEAASRAETKRNNLFNNAISTEIQDRENKKFSSTYGAGVDEQGKPLPENPTARAIAEYRVPPPSSRSLASGPGMALMDQVMKINPDYRGEEFPTRAKMRAAFTSGPQGQTLNALNTAIVHLDQFTDAAKALDNGDFQPGNTAYNALRTAFGSTAPTNFQGIKTIMAGELASAFKKSGATDTEIKNVEDSVNGAASTAQLVDYATKVAMPALSGKAATFDEMYHQTMGDKDPWTPFTKSAASVMQKYGVSASHAGGAGAVPPPAAGAPAVGTTRMVGGKPYTWDGHGWLPK